MYGGGDTPFPPGLNKDSVSAGAGQVFFHAFPGDVAHFALPWVREPNFVPLVLVMTLTLTLGVVGNGLVVSVLCCGAGRGAPRGAGRCVTFPCLLSMAVADMLFLCVCVPHELCGLFLAHWPMSSFLCKLSGFVEAFSAMAASFNLILISLER
jgi:hypothetical protein